MKDGITTSSVEEALDFSAALLAAAVEMKVDAGADGAGELCKMLARYIEWRYHGEFGLALEMLADMGHACSKELHCSPQFWRQLLWVAERLQLNADELSGLSIPDLGGSK